VCSSPLRGFDRACPGRQGSISGLVSDPAGALIPRTKVVLLNPATGVTQHTVTSGAGLYTFLSLNPASTKSPPARRDSERCPGKNHVSVDQVTEVNITLQVGAPTETVTVTEGVELVEASKSSVGSLIPAEAIDRVPWWPATFSIFQLSAGVNAVNGSPNSSDSMQSIQNI